MKTTKRGRAGLAIGVLLLIGGFASPARPQVTYGSIVGNVRDVSGAMMAGVRVTISNQDTGEDFKQLTNLSGAYAFTTLFPGVYSIHAEMTGFRAIDIRDVTLQVTQTARYDLTMQVGQKLRHSSRFIDPQHASPKS